MSRRSAIAILLAALAVQGAIAALGLPPSGRALAGDEQTYVGVARAWAAGAPAELEPLWPPGYPALLAFWLGAFGTLDGLLVVQVLAHLAAAGVLARLALRITGEARIAAVAAALFALDPQIAAFALTYWPETLHLALLLALLEATMTGLNRWPGAALYGIGLGAALLLKSLLTPLVPVLLVVAWLAATPHGRSLRAVVAVGALAATIAPVIWTHHLRYGFWGLADSTRFNLVLGLTDRSPRSLRDDRAHTFYLEYRAAGATFAERQRALGARLDELVATRGLGGLAAGQLPRQLFRLFDRESYFSAMLPPDGALAAAGQGFRSPPPGLARALEVLGLILYGAVLALAPLGLARLATTRPLHRLAPLLLLIGYPLALALLLHVKARYRLVLMPGLDLAAAAGWATIADLRGSEGPRVPSAGVLSAGLTGAVLLLFFGFGAGRFG